MIVLYLTQGIKAILIKLISVFKELPPQLLSLYFDLV
ncbi:hypothetical protein SAMN05443549_108126 [Flavobacterium fluvii]|uniref:Uncharacterized protein n=1 Tax=Flavobacterium fluvii TaxID=468056 RepID=A0A1M5NQR7_9FLAO|nr:hypothetical protein SAMN05443549_108126 [Flavobacterium fluvii]